MITWDLPKIMPSKPRIYIFRGDGMVFNRRQKRWDPAIDMVGNPPYHKLGHARNGAARAALISDGQDITVREISNEAEH